MSSTVSTAAGKLALLFAPFALGLAIGFLTAVVGLRRWLVTVSGPQPDMTRSLLRVAIQSLFCGVVLTVMAANWLSESLLHGSHPFPLQNALWGLMVGMGIAVRWVYLRGVR